MTTKNILVIDDSPNHLAAAKQVFGEGFDLTVCDSHDDGHHALYRGPKEPEWDAVLCDLLMPAGRYPLGEKGLKYLGQEMALGWGLALTAAKKGVKLVAVVTDINHHDHPASGAIDSVTRHIFTIDGSKVLFTDRVKLVGITGTDYRCTECINGETESESVFEGKKEKYKYKCRNCDGTTIAWRSKGKDWKGIYDWLVAGKEKEED